MVVIVSGISMAMLPARTSELTVGWPRMVTGNMVAPLVPPWGMRTMCGGV